MKRLISQNILEFSIDFAYLVVNLGIDVFYEAN